MKQRTGAFRSLVHSEYVERDGAVELVDPTALERAAIERQLAIASGETQGPLQVTLPSVFSNISDDPEERQIYWRQIEESERTPRTHELICKPESSPHWWEELEVATKLDNDLKRHLLDIRQMSERLAAESGEPPIKPAPLKVKGKGKISGEEEAGRLLAQAMALRGYDPSDPPIRFKSGPGGLTQIRMVAELPHELNAEDRARVVMKFCELIAGDQADHITEMTSTSAAEGAITETVLPDDLNNENVVPDVECPASEETDSKVGGEFVSDGRSDGHEGGKEKSDEASQVETIESTEGDEWLRALHSFASRNNKKVRW